jgi:mRNA-degrading endonuclease toxin of MazEF toxin-antitoxin module
VSALFSPGCIVLADWRGDALPREPNKLRPAIIVEDSGLFDETYQNLIVVPLTSDQAFAIKSLSVEIAPSSENGCPATCWAAAYLVAATSKARITPTPSRITEAQLVSIRAKIALSIGFSDRL